MSGGTVWRSWSSGKREKVIYTPAFGLPAKYIFHAVCPAWHGGFFGEAKQLAGAAQTQAVLKKRRILPEEQQNTRLRIVCKAQYMGGCGLFELSEQVET